MIEKYIHAISVAIRHNQEAAITTDRFNCSVSISVFSDVVARNRRTNTLFAPAIFRFIDSAKARFVLKHQTHCGIVEFFRSFLYNLFNFFLRLQSPPVSLFSDVGFVALFFSIHADEALNISVLS